MFDFGKFLGWIRDGLFEPNATWEQYKSEGHSWKATAMQLSLPLLVASGVLVLILGWVFASSYAFGRSGGFGAFIWSLVMGLVWFGLGGFIASFLASKFGGKDSFDQAWAALSFAAIPGVLGSVLGALPWIGWLLSFAAFIWSIILLWQALPVFLDVPLEKRAGHFFATLGLSIVALIVTGVVLGALGLSSMGGGNSYGGWDEERIEREISERMDNASRSIDASRNADDYDYNRSGSGSTSSGNEESMFGFGREVDYLEAANNDRYSPPGDGRLTEQQVERTARFFAAAKRLRDSSTKNLEKLGEENAEPSLSDIFKGVKGLVSAGTAEMQAVKSGNGNWAEHEWVKKQLFEARLHQDLNDTTAHNYELYQEYQDQLDEWL